MNMLLTLPFTCPAFLGLGEFEFSVYGHNYFPERVSNHCQSLRRAFSEICIKLDAVPLSDPPRNHIQRLQTKGRRNHHVHPGVWNFVHRPQRYASTIIYRCITLLKLLHRWHQSRKLWIRIVNSHSAVQEIPNIRVRVRVTLRLTISQSVCLGIEHMSPVDLLLREQECHWPLS
jgi:hypothetical protein